jgi:Tfp pilus assembly protein PilW
MSIKVQPCGQRAFTLIDCSVGMVVSAIVLAALLGFSVYASRSFAALSNYVELEQKSQNALDTMTRDIRQTLSLTSYETTTLNGRTITNKLTFVDSDSQPLVFVFQNSVLNKVKGGVTTMLLTNCDFLTFQIFQRNPVSGAMTFIRRRMRQAASLLT